MSISALDRDTVKLITTTQIITSVSGATKELIENALDADARNIEINLIDNGCTLIEVKDDGCGISKDDAPYMALSSYTSKISNFSDLDSLETYGFRGEALYALSAVADLTIVSKTEQDEAAVSYTVDHSGRILKSEPCHRPTGTTVQVRQLFKQVPVRRQIITNPKKANQDVRTLDALIKSYGMCKYSTRISYRVDNNIIFAKPSLPSLEEAVTYILGRKVTCNMDWIDITNAEIKGKVMVPSKNMQNIPEAFHSGMQYIFINNRPIKYKEMEKILTKTILEGLGQEISSRKKPMFVLYILVNAANVDVNLEPNKTAVLLKEQNNVIDTIQRCLENFYDIHKEEEAQQENNCENVSLSDYQDYTQKIVGDDERPACKKRKLEAGECTVDFGEKNSNPDDIRANGTDENNSRHKVPEQISANEGRCVDAGSKRFDNNTDLCDIGVPPISLSDSDSRDSQNFTLTTTIKDDSFNLQKEAAESNTAEESPPFELTPESETLSQLPCVDLGDDFEWDKCSSFNADEQRNDRKKSAHTEAIDKEDNSCTKKPVTVKEWSKGHVPGLKGGTDIQAYDYEMPNESIRDDTVKNTCGGFLKFSKHIRPKVTEQNPTMSAPQIANIVTNLWKKLSPEERGYYRDLARDEKLEREAEKRNEEKEQDAKRKQEIDANKNKNRLLRALEKMKSMNLENKENLVMRTTVPWDINLTKVTDSFLNNNPCENTNITVGRLHSDLWVVHKSAHIWILDSKRLNVELHIPGSEAEDDSTNIEQRLQHWFATKDDLSLLHPIHSLTQNKHNS